MNQTLLIRPVELRDFEPWKVLWDGYNAFYGREGPTALPEENTRMTWSRFFDAYEPVHALAAEADGQLLGLAHYLFHRSTIEINPPCPAPVRPGGRAQRRHRVPQGAVARVERAYH